MESNFIVATSKHWNVKAFERHVDALPGWWLLVTRSADLERVASLIKPRYIFFPHWSDIVPRVFLERHECVCFHMTDVPYGRGGSPLQNLIERGHESTVLTALRMTEDLDAGPVYAKQPLSLEGRAEEIFEQVANDVYDLIDHIVRHEPEPTEQHGEPTSFKRRRPAQSRLPESSSLGQVYDHIRMLDAPSYPKAFVGHGQWRIELSHADLGDGVIEGRFRLEYDQNRDENDATN